MKIPDTFATTFLELTAEWHLDLYVLDTLKNDPPRKETRQSVLNDILRCSTSIGLNESLVAAKNLGRPFSTLIKFLLDEGTDPNDVAPQRLSEGSMTAWGAFLGLAMKKLDDWRLELDSDLPELRDLLRYFLTRGANPHQEFIYHSVISKSTKKNKLFLYSLRASANLVLELYDLPCDPTQSHVFMETTYWEIHGRESYRITSGGSALLSEAFKHYWKTEDNTPEREAARRECYRRCLKVRESVRDPDYSDPPLAEHCTEYGDRISKGLCSDELDESSDEEDTLSWWNVI